jgi:hypothetical protein
MTFMEAMVFGGISGTTYFVQIVEVMMEADSR